MPRTRPTKKPRLKACRKCGALAPGDAKICPYCGASEFTTNWEGMIIILDPESSVLARELGIEKPAMFAIKVAGRVVKRRALQA